MKIKNILKSIACLFCLKNKCCDSGQTEKMNQKTTKGVTMVPEKKDTKKKDSKKKEVSTQIETLKVDAPKRKKP